jgi:hypothetical protein
MIWRLRSKSVVAFLHLPDVCDDLLYLILGKSLFQECVRRIPVHLSIGACDDEFTDFLVRDLLRLIRHQTGHFHCKLAFAILPVA